MQLRSRTINAARYSSGQLGKRGCTCSQWIFLYFISLFWFSQLDQQDCCDLINDLGLKKLFY